MPGPEFINVPVRDGSPPEAGEREVDVVAEYIEPEFVQSERPDVPEGQMDFKMMLMTMMTG